eukprot:TRINITY_DN14015_c0_g4_i1.p2 TRINITY_DN14015_c0_g4~~TRINITY_DN14015_c0_g4_i1.p2  ORF type:complete len:349 (-),score=24.09 TRINITY_DN14015_c0_g4_i1:308-1354(-)
MFAPSQFLFRIYSSKIMYGRWFKHRQIAIQCMTVNNNSNVDSSSETLQNQLDELHNEHQRIVGLYRGVKKKDIPVQIKNQVRILKRKRQLIRKRIQRREEHANLMSQIETACVGLDPEQKQQYMDQLRLQRVQQFKQQQQRLEGVLNGQIAAAQVVVECSFIQDCSEREMKSLAKQIERGMGYNKKANFPVNLSLTSFSGGLKGFSDKLGAEHWSCHKHTENVLQLFPVDQLVILSPDAEQPLQEVEKDKIYVIGGLVDRTVQKNITQQFGFLNGLQTRRLQVNELIESETDLQCQEQTQQQGFHSQHHILTINQVIQALVDFQEYGNWQQVLQRVVPTRKRRRYTQT